MRLLTALFLSILSASFAIAQPLADRAPADTMIYVGWSGAQNMPGYAGSHFEAIIKESNIPAVFKQVLPGVIARVRQENAEVADGMQVGYDLLAAASKYPTAFFFAGLDRTDPKKPLPKFGVICRAGTDAAALQQKLSGLLERLPPDAPRVTATRSNDDVLMLMGYADGESLAAGSEALSASPGFSAAMQQVQGDGVVCAFVDFQNILKLVDQLVDENAPPEAKEIYSKGVESFGLRGLKCAAFSEGFDGKDWMSRSFIDAPSPRKGLLALADTAPMGDDLLKAIPATADLAMAGSFDFAKLVSELRTAVGGIDAEYQKYFDQGLGAVTLAIGKNFQNDVLEPLGSQWAMYIAPEVAGGGVTGVVLLNKVDDAYKAKTGLMALSIFASNTSMSVLSQQDVPITIQGRQVKYGDLAINYLAIPVLTPSWAVQGDYAMFGLFPQALIGASRQLTGGKSLLDNTDYAALRKRLGDQKASGVVYVNLPRTAPMGYQGLLFASRLIGVADLFGVPTPPVVIPPYHVFAEHLSVAGGVTWVDAAGIHGRAVCPFPGANLFASQGGGALASIAPMAMQASVLMPSLNRARETSNRVECARNLRQLALQSILYANENRGKFPPDMATLVKSALANNVGGDVFLCPSSDDHLPAGFDQMTVEQRAAWLTENTSYEYDGKLLTNASGGQVVLLHEKPHHHGGDGMNMAYCDGHVDFQGANSVQEELQRGR